MRAQFVRGADPKDTMSIGNKHAREAQKLIAAFKEIDPSFEPKITDDQTNPQQDLEIVIVSVRISVNNRENTFALAWVKSGLEYYLVSWGPGKTDNGGQESYPKLEQAKKKMKDILSKEI